jgi:hypothetical protein
LQGVDQLELECLDPQDDTAAAAAGAGAPLPARCGLAAAVMARRADELQSVASVLALDIHFHWALGVPLTVTFTWPP